MVFVEVPAMFLGGVLALLMYSFMTIRWLRQDKERLHQEILDLRAGKTTRRKRWR